MDPRPLRCQRDHLPVVADCFVQLPLAFVGLARRLVQPDRIRGDARELDGLKVRVVPEQSPGVVQHFGIVGVEPAQLERHRDGLPVAIEIRVRTLEMETGHSPQRWIGRLMKRLFESRERLLMSANFRERHRQERPDVRQRRLQLQRLLQRRDRVGKTSLLEVDEPEPRMDLGDVRLQLAHARVGPFGIAHTAPRRARVRPPCTGTGPAPDPPAECWPAQHWPAEQRPRESRRARPVPSAATASGLTRNAGRRR